MQNNGEAKSTISSVTFELSSSSEKVNDFQRKQPTNVKRAIAIIASEDVNLELFLLRLLSYKKDDAKDLVYICVQPWLQDIFRFSNLVVDVYERIIDEAQYSKIISSKDYIAQLDSKVISQNTTKDTGISLVENHSRVNAFRSEWLTNIAQPYVGFSWDIRPDDQTQFTGISHSLTELLPVVEQFSGNVIVLQNRVSRKELDYISQKLQRPVLDCSDLNHDPEEMLALVSMLDEHLGPPDFACHLRYMNQKPVNLIWPANIQRLPLWSKIQQLCWQGEKLFLEKESGWSLRYGDLISTQQQESENYQVEQKKKIDSHSNLNIDALIEYAAGKTTNRISDEVEQRVVSMCEYFNTISLTQTSSLNIFVYHTDMGEAGQLKYKDVSLNLSQYDYKQVLQIFIEAVNRWHPEAIIYLVTNASSELFSLADKQVKVVGLNVDVTQPMYERVHAMCAYVHSSAFDANTLFLDSDAFINASFSDLLKADFDIAVTFRDIPGLMPVNEGVLIARNQNLENVREFFKRYLASYGVLAEDSVVQQYYENIRKWRGGQLTLNAISYNASPFTSYRLTDIGGVDIKSLPCDPYNYSWEYKESIDSVLLDKKYVIHVKGARKESLQKISELIRQPISNTSQPKMAVVHNSEQSVDFVAPHFAIFNKMYNEPPFTHNDQVKKFVGHIATSAEMINCNQAHSGAHLADDLFVWFRNLGFQEEPAFIDAFAPYETDSLLRARIWRVYMLCWALKSCCKIQGDFVDLGCYDGRTVHIMLRYIGFNSIDKDYYIYDLFENPTVESKKAKHGPGLFDEVQQLFVDYKRLTVIKGPVPDSFQTALPEKIAFAQIDLNEADAEMAVLETIYDRLVSGGIIIFDDYGFKRYVDSHVREKKFFEERGDIVFESPTGQGLFIKRG